MQEQLRKNFGFGGGSSGPGLDLGELNAPPSARDALAAAEKAQSEAQKVKKAAKQAQKVTYFDPCACF